MPTVTATLDDGREVSFESDKQDWTKEEIEQVVSQQLAGQQPEAQPEQPKTSATGAFGRSVATGVLPSAAAGAGFVAGAELGAPFAPASFGIVPLVTGAIGAAIAGYGASKAQQVGIHAAAPEFEQQQQSDTEQHPVASAAGRIVSMAPSFAVAPGQSVKGLAAIPAILRGTANAAQQQAAKATAAQVGVQAGLTTAQTAIMERKLPSKGELAEATVAALIYGNPRIKALLPKSVAVAAETTGVKPDDTIRQRSAAEIPLGETPGNRAPLEQGVSEPKAPSEAQAQAPAQEQQSLRLTPDDEAHLEAERQSVDVPVEVRAPSENEPFARGQIATIDRSNNSIVIRPEEFSAWLNEDMKGLSPERKRLAVRSLLAEERNHLATSPEDAGSYWNSLSTPERLIEQKVYTNRFGGRLDISSRDMGYEAIRRRMQRLARMDSTETAAAAGAERWGLKSLEVLGDVIRGIRETLGTRASKEGLAILDRVQGNLDAAKAVAAGAEPSALRRKQPADEKQTEFLLPPAERTADRATAVEAGAKPFETPAYLTPDKVYWERIERKGAIRERPFRPITDAERKSPLALSEILTRGAREGGANRPESVTHNVTALFDKFTGRVDVVSTYKSGREGVMLADPSLISENSARPHRQISTLLSRYTPLYSISLKEPVRNFHERYANLADFQNRFGNAATEEASKRLGNDPQSSLAGSGKAGPFQAEQFAMPVEITPPEPPASAEAGAIHDFFQGQIPKTPAEMQTAIAKGAGRASRQMISGLQRMMEFEQAKDPNISAEEAISRSLDNIYDDLTQSKDRGSFIQRAMGRFAEPTPKANKPAGASPQEPSSLRRVREAKERTLAESERVYRGISTLIERRDVKDAIPASRDMADNVGNNIGRESERSVRIASNLTAKGRRAKQQVLNALMPMVSSHAITMDFDMTKLSPAARDAFLAMTYKDPRWKAATMKRMSSNPAEVAEGQWTQARMKSAAYGKLIANKDLRVDQARYGFDENALSQLDKYMAQIDAGAAALRAKRSTGGWLDKWQAGHDLKVLQKMREDLSWLRKNWTDPDVRSGALEMRRQLDARYQREADNGYNLRYDADYVPGRYEGELYNDGAILFPGIRILGKEWRRAKTFDTMYDAAEQGYVPVNRDGAAIVGHRARQGERSIQYKLWTENLKNLQDPSTGLGVVVDAKRGPDGKLRPPSADYKLMTLRPGDDPVAVHVAYEKLIDQMTSQSKIQDFAPARIILELEQRLKHTLLVGDFFHLTRLTYYAASIMGRKAGFRKGLAAIDFAEKDLPEAVRQGLVSQESADWVTEKIPVHRTSSAGTSSIFMRSRREIAGDFQRQGLNVGQIQDALYKDLTKGLPIIGPYNKWLFDSYTRGLMMEAAVKEFERLNKARPDIDSQKLTRDIAKDINRFFGSIGRQGWFKSKTWQDLSRLAFLAPQWVEGLVMKEAGFVKRVGALPARAVGMGGRQGLPPLGTLGRGIGYGVLTMLAITQAINLIFRGKPTWQNEEEGHKFDAWIPGAPGEPGFFLNPLSVFNELSHNLWRYGQTKPKAWDAFSQIGQNKLSPFGRLGLVLATSRSPTGEYQTTTANVLKKGAEQLAPVPISFGKVVREVGHAVAPNTIAPNAPGALQRQTLQWAGLKAEPAESANQRIVRLAQKFKDENGLGKTGIDFSTNDQPGYSKLRTALRNGDSKGAAEIIKQLGKPQADMIKAMKNWASLPWTGSRKGDKAFIATLTDAQMEMASQARLERQQIVERFYDVLLNSK